MRRSAPTGKRPRLEGASYFIIVLQQAYSPRPGGEKVKHYTVTESVRLAVGLLIAALHQAGLATFTGTRPARWPL
jgi:iodotyrosine deiodinase